MCPWPVVWFYKLSPTLLLTTEASWSLQIFDPSVINWWSSIISEMLYFWNNFWPSRAFPCISGRQFFLFRFNRKYQAKKEQGKSHDNEKATKTARTKTMTVYCGTLAFGSICKVPLFQFFHLLIIFCDVQDCPGNVRYKWRPYWERLKI